MSPSTEPSSHADTSTSTARIMWGVSVWVISAKLPGMS